MRKTVPLTTLVNHVNAFNKLAVASPAERIALNCLLENCLHQARAYQGFRYLSAKEVPADCLPGIIWDDASNRALAFPDATRVEYYYTEKGR